MATTSDEIEQRAPLITWVWQGNAFSCLPGIFKDPATQEALLETALPANLTDQDDIKAPSSVPEGLKFSTILAGGVLIGLDPGTGTHHFFVKSKAPAPLRAQVPANTSRFRR